MTICHLLDELLNFLVLGQFLLGANLLGFAESQPQPSNKPVNSTMAKIKQEEDVVALSSGDEVKCECLKLHFSKSNNRYHACLSLLA